MKNTHVRDDYTKLEISVILKKTLYFGISSYLQQCSKDSTDNSYISLTKS